MSEISNKLIILRLFETSGEVTGPAWLESFLTLRNEATAYANNFLIAAGDLLELARNIGAGTSAMATVNKLELQRKEAAKAAVLKQKKEILAKRKDLTPVQREALEKLVAGVLTNIDKNAEGKQDARETLLRESQKITIMQDALETSKERALPEAKEAAAKLTVILKCVEQLPEPKIERVTKAFSLWKLGLRGMIGACNSYVRWVESGDIQFLTGILYPGPSMTAGINAYLRGCGSRKAWLAGAGPEAKRQVENRPQGETMLEIIQPFCKEDILSEIPEVIKISYS